MSSALRIFASGIRGRTPWHLGSGIWGRLAFGVVLPLLTGVILNLRNSRELQTLCPERTVVRFNKISPAYMACRKCVDYINEIRIAADSGISKLRL